MRRRILFRFEAGPRVGWGHRMRCRALAEALPKSADGSWMVFDLPRPDHRGHRRARAAGFRVMCIDDHGGAGFDVDLLLNQNPVRTAYPRSRIGRRLSGPAFCLLRRPFRRPFRRVIRRRADRVLLCFGGTDAHGLAPKYQRMLAGRFRLRTAAGVSAAQMRRLMLWADVGIFATGTVCWEAARLGLPQMIVPTHPRIARALVRRGVARIAGDPARLLADAAARRRMSRAGRAWVDGRGVERVLKYMKSLG